MGDEWFTEPDGRGELTVEYRENGWYLADSPRENEIKCMLPDGASPAPTESPQQLDGTVSKFVAATGNDPSYLFVEIVQEHDGSVDAHPETEDAGGASDLGVAGGALTAKSERRRSLCEFSGSDEYVSVEAVIDSVVWVQKDESGVPDIKGTLVDDSVREGVVFVVNEDVGHPYLEEGKRYVFEGVKDHYYDAKGEVQVMITEHTEFTEGRTSEDSTPSGSSAGKAIRRNRSKDKQGSSVSDDLQKIASEKIADEEFTIRREDTDSVVGQAKKRARSQGRDPAIDPTFQLSDDEDEDTDD